MTRAPESRRLDGNDLADEARRHVVVVVPWLMGGGAQSALTQLLMEMKQSGRARIAVFVLFEGSTGVERLRTSGVEVVEFGRTRSPRGAWQANRDVRRVARGADALYSLMRGSHVVIGLSPGVLGSARFVATFHQLPSKDGQGLRGRVEDILVRRATRRAALVTSPSERGAREVIERGLAAPATVVYEPNIVRESVQPRVAPRTGLLDPVRLLFAGRLTAQKGLDRLPGLLRATPSSIHLRIAGAGEDESMLRKALGDVGGPHRVEFCGELADVTPEIDWADAIVMPSRVELNPMIVAEARRRGRPTVASDIEAFQDLATEGGIALFASPDEFASVIYDLAHDESRRFSLFHEAEKPTRENGSDIVRTLLN